MATEASEQLDQDEADSALDRLARRRAAVGDWVKQNKLRASLFTLGAFWFTRQEERWLKGLLEDPDEYERYKARVPALFPRLLRR